MSESFSIDVNVAGSVSPEPRMLKRPTLQLALKQQAKRRRRNTSIATQGNLNGMPPIPRVIVKVLPPLPLNEPTKVNEISESEAEEVQVVSQRNATSLPTQTTMREVLASIPGFKTTKRTTRNLSAAAQIQRAQEGCVDLQNPSSILAKANLRGILNKHTFGTLPPLYQHKLIQLLPEVDRCSDGSSKLSSTALSNEFFGRACQKWRDRLASGEFTPEFQQKIRAEAERDKGKLDPWKVKHFEPFWGSRGESSSSEPPVAVAPTSKSCSSVASKKKTIVSEVAEDDTPPKKRIIGRKIGRRKMKRKKSIRKIVTHLDSEDKNQVTSEDTPLIYEEVITKEAASVEPAETQPVEMPEESGIIQLSISIDETVNSPAIEFMDTLNVEKETPSTSHPTQQCDSDQHSLACQGTSGNGSMEMVDRLDDPLFIESPQREINLENDKLVDTLQESTQSPSEKSETQTEGNVNTVVQETSTGLTASEEDDAFYLNNSHPPSSIKDSLPPSDCDEEKISKDKSANDCQMRIDDGRALSEMKDFLNSSVGHFVQEDSSPEDFFQSHQVTEALELLRDIHDREDSAPVAIEPQTITPTTAENVSTDQRDEVDLPENSKSSQHQVQMVEPPAKQDSTAELDSSITSVPKQHELQLVASAEKFVETKTDDTCHKNDHVVSNVSTHVSAQSEAPAVALPHVSNAEASTVIPEKQSATKIETPIQQPTTVTLTLPFPVTLPLNLPLTLPISLPPGTTLVVSDPSSLVGLRTSNTCTTAEVSKTVSSVTSLTPIAPNKPRIASTSSSPSRILPRSTQPTTNPVAVAGTSSSTTSGLIAPRNGSGKQSQPSRAPPGTVNLERSYRICQAVIENSPNCEQLKAQLRPPSAFSSSVVVLPSGSPVTGNVAASSANRSNNGKNGAKNNLATKPCKGNATGKIANQQGVGDVKVVPQSLGATSPSGVILVHPGTANMGVVDQQAVVTSKVVAPSPVQLPRQQVVCITPNASEAVNHLSSKTPSANLASNRTIGVTPQQLRPASTPPQPKPSVFPNVPQQAQQSTTTAQCYQQQQPSTITVGQQVTYLPFNNWSQQRPPQQQDRNTPKAIAPATVRPGTHTQQVYNNLQQTSSNSFIQEQTVQQQTPVAPRTQQPVNTRQPSTVTIQTQQYASSSNVQVNLQPMAMQQLQKPPNQQQQGIRQSWSGPSVQQQKQININTSSVVPPRNPVATPQTPPFVQNDVQLVSMGMSMRAQVPGNGSSITPQLPINADPAITGNTNDSSNEEAIEKAPQTTDCDCQLKAMVMCQRCGAFCHDDCIGPTQLCFTCIIP
ncbi:polycomb protein Asx-like [Daphnia carinata]|uniref:polycomb protein Asx-like n=1 Tax=Daphnia carinata TaxID=120202 RepID=UPI00257EF9BB|nr:polycomb protein Asx-like [Daphnia carinata]